MARTNMVIDDQLVAEAMRRFGLPTKREAVDFVLRHLVSPVLSREAMLEMEGCGWDGDLDVMRTDEVESVGSFSIRRSGWSFFAAARQTRQAPATIV